MFFGFKATLRHADNSTPRRRQRRLVPSLSDSASYLEERVLLSGAAEKAHAAEVAHPAAKNPANTHAGQVVIRLFESILGTDPTSAQLTKDVHQLNGGVGVKALRKELVATASRQQSQASPVASSPGSAPTVMFSSSGGTSPALAHALPAGLSAPSNPPTLGMSATQIQLMMEFRAGSGSGSGRQPTSITITSPSGSSTPATTMATSTSMSGSSMSPSGLSQLMQSQLTQSQLMQSQLTQSQLMQSQLTQSQLAQSQLTQSQLTLTPFPTSM